jgi:hypothetical protein
MYVCVCSSILCSIMSKLIIKMWITTWTGWNQTAKKKDQLNFKYFEQKVRSVHGRLGDMCFLDLCTNGAVGPSPSDHPFTETAFHVRPICWFRFRSFAHQTKLAINDRVRSCLRHISFTKKKNLGATHLIFDPSPLRRPSPPCTMKGIYLCKWKHSETLWHFH